MNEWVGLITTVVGVGGTGGILGACGVAWRAWSRWQGEERDKQRAHEATIVTRVEKIADDAAKRTQETADKFEKTVTTLQADMRAESKQTVTLLLGVQKEMTATVGELGKEVHSLSIAINEMRNEISKKADRDALSAEPVREQGPRPRVPKQN